MKKTVAIILTIVSLMFLLTACGNKEFRCEYCGQTKNSKSHELDVMGTKMTLCDDCYKALEKAANGN